MDIFQVLTAKLPTLKTPLQLVGFVVLVAGVLITRATNRDAVVSQVSIGAIGVVMIVFAQVFEKLPAYPREKRASVTIALFLAFCALVVFLVTAAIVSTPMTAMPVHSEQTSIAFIHNMPLSEVIKAISKTNDVTVLSPSCSQDQMRTVIRGNPEPIIESNVHNLLLSLRDRAMGRLDYSVTQSGRRYEIHCN